MQDNEQVINEQVDDEVTDEVREARKAARAAGHRIERVVIDTDPKH